MDKYNINDVIPICNNLKRYKRERIIVIGLNRDYSVNYSEVLFTGKKHTCDFNFTKCITNLIEHECWKFVISHNHPTRDSSPSFFDDTLTKSIKNRVKKYSIEFVDHIIISAKEDAYFSYSENNFRYIKMEEEFGKNKLPNSNIKNVISL